MSSTALRPKEQASSASSDIAPSQSLPPSPPVSLKPFQATLSPVSRSLSVVALCKRGALDCGRDWRASRLLQSEFAELERRLYQQPVLWDYWRNKVRYDYEGEAEGRLVLRMPSAVHECFTDCMEKALGNAIISAAERLEARGEVEAAKHVRAIRNSRSTTLELTVPELENSSQDSNAEPVIVRRSPDASFHHPDAGAYAPSLVVEVSYSQQRKALPRLAESYVIDSQDAIRCVIGLDITYGNSNVKTKGQGKEATVSVWRPDVDHNSNGEEIGICKMDVHDAMFRDDNGNTCDGTLDLTLADFLPLTTYDAVPLDFTSESIRLSFADMASFLTAAEASATPGIKLQHGNSARKRFRKRKRTPSEELSDSREDAFAQLENAELLKEINVDGEWEESSGGAMGGEQNVHVVERRRSSRRRVETAASGAS